MGWTFQEKPGNVKEYMDSLYTFETETKKTTVLESYLVRLREYYALCQTVNKETGEVTCWAGVAMLQYVKGDRYNFGYKDMDETVGPYINSAPVGMIERLNEIAPVDPESYAAKWREGCLLAAQERAEKRAKTKAVKLTDFKPGQKLKLYGKVFTLSHIATGRLKRQKTVKQFWMVDTGHALTTKQLAEAEVIG